MSDSFRYYTNKHYVPATFGSMDNGLYIQIGGDGNRANLCTIISKEQTIDLLKYLLEIISKEV